MQREFIDHGYVVLKNLVTVTTALKEMREHFPEDAANPVQDSRSDVAALFPSSDVQQPGFTQKMYHGNFERFISKLKPDQLQTLGVPGDLRWSSKTFTSGIKARYQWTGFDCMEYVHYSNIPPPVPMFWYWSNLKMTSHGNSVAFRDAIFAKANEVNIHIGGPRQARWCYTFETVTPRYVSAECHFFRHIDTTYVDINLLEGDRFTWAAISRHIRGEGLTYKRPMAKPIRADMRLEAMVEHCMDEDIFDLIGSDFNPAKLLPLLADASHNIKRCVMRALYYCDTPFDVSRIEPYCRGGGTFLEKRIQYWANKIVRKGASAAHL